MFQDDRMIPVFSVLVLMITIGMFLQRFDAVDRLMNGGGAPPVVLHDDEITLAGNELTRIDVFANDENVDDRTREGLRIVSAPSCGRLLVRSGALEYVPELGCDGRETIRYSYEGADPAQVATVNAVIRSGVEKRPTGKKPLPEIAYATSGPDAGPVPALAALESREDGGEGTPSPTTATSPLAARVEPVALAKVERREVTPPASNERSDVPDPGAQLAHRDRRGDDEAGHLVDKSPDAAAEKAPPSEIDPLPAAAQQSPEEHEPALASSSASDLVGPQPAASPADAAESITHVSTGRRTTDFDAPGSIMEPTEAAALAAGPRGPREVQGDLAGLNHADDAIARRESDEEALEGERIASLPPAGQRSGESLPAVDVAAGPVEPLRSGVEIAALVLPSDDDRATAPAYSPAGERQGTIRRTPARPQPGAVASGDRLLLWRPPTPRPAAFPERGGSLAIPSGDVSPLTAAADGRAYVLSVTAHDGTEQPGPGLHGEPGALPPAAETAAPAGPVLASLPPGLSPGSHIIGPALGVMPVEPLSLPPGFESVVVPRPRPAGIAGRDPAEATDGTMLAEPVGPCTGVPGLTLDVRRAGVTVLGVAAPCQAGTVAELTYSGLGLAVPLDGNGQGSVSVPGFEPVSAAKVTFRDGTELQFELPFLGVERVSRVALAWDAPVELGLNALENGAALNSPGHVRPGAARSFDEVREKGGGYLSVFWPVAGVGQSVQIYSWFHRDYERAGVVRMMVDFVSRDRDRLASACGDGRDAAPHFLVLRSEAGRPEKPVLRRLERVDCRQVVAGENSGRLISGVVDDLVITRR